MNRSVTITVRPIIIQVNPDGAERLLAHIAKPGYPASPLRKLRNWRLWLDPYETPEHNRSRRQIEQGLEDVWRQLSIAVTIGDRFDRAVVHHEGSARRDHHKLQEYSAPATAKETTQWKYWLPVAHAAAGFRQVMFQRKQALAFDLSRTATERRKIVHDLLLEDHSWIEPAIDAAQARLAMSRTHVGMQSPAETRFFILAPTEGEPRSHH